MTLLVKVKSLISRKGSPHVKYQYIKNTIQTCQLTYFISLFVHTGTYAYTCEVEYLEEIVKTVS